MSTFSCPSCGAAVEMRSAIAVTAVCPYCRTLVVRHGSDVEAIGQCAVLPDDISPLQLGTTGKDGNNGFVLIGRAKVTWEDGCWNEWLMLYDNGEQGWLAEAQGSLAITRPVAIPEAAARDLQALPIGQVLSIAGVHYTVSDIKEATYAGYEGEFPSDILPAGTVVKTIDFTAPDGSFLSATCAGAAPPEVYRGAYVNFDALHLSNLRELSGWTKPRTVPQAASTSQS